MTTVEQIAALIRSARLDLSDEKKTQSDFETILNSAGIRYEREVRLSSSDIVDFLIDGTAVEFKLRGTPKKVIYRQLQRYVKHSAVDRILLASCTSMGLPEQIGGKDSYFVKLGEAWL